MELGNASIEVRQSTGARAVRTLKVTSSLRSFPTRGRKPGARSQHFHKATPLHIESALMIDPPNRAVGHNAE